MGFKLLATEGTGQALRRGRHRVSSASSKLQEGQPEPARLHGRRRRSQLIINTPSGKGARTDEGRIRAAAVAHGVPCITTIAGARRRGLGHGTAAGGQAECLCVTGLAAKVGRP